MEQTDQIHEALSKAGLPTTVTPELVGLDKTRITSDTEVPEEVFLFRFAGTPCFPRGDLTTVAGPAKGGKTFFLSMLMACAFRGQVLSLERDGTEPLRVLWYDTEQSRYTTKRIMTERIRGLLVDAEEQTTFPDEQYYVFNVRDKTPKERLDYLELAIETYRPDICIVDGIADLLNDINSGPDSVELMQQMMTMAGTYMCNITAGIHLNRSGEKLNLRGWLGTLLVQKPYEVFNCDRVEKGQAFTVTHTVSRRFNTKNELCYAIGDNGLPVMSEAQADNTRKDCNGRQPDSTTFNKEFVDNDAADQHLPWLFRKLFTAAFGSAAMLGSNDLEQRVMDLANIKQKQYYYKVLDEAERQRIVRKELTRTGRVGSILVPPS